MLIVASCTGFVCLFLLFFAFKGFFVSGDIQLELRAAPLPGSATCLRHATVSKLFQSDDLMSFHWLVHAWCFVRNPGFDYGIFSQTIWICFLSHQPLGTVRRSLSLSGYNSSSHSLFATWILLFLVSFIGKTLPDNRSWTLADVSELLHSRALSLR
jgi:hypothetical protein